MRKPVIVVSGPPGAGSTTVARLIAKKLGLKFFSPGFIQKGLVKGKNESQASLQAWGTEKCRSRDFHRDLDREQKEMAEKGGVVICGKLSIRNVPGADLKVWLDVPLEVRARRSSGRDKIPYEEAHRSLSERQEIERKEWKRIYGFDYFGQKEEADIVLDSSSLTAEETVEVILKLFSEKKKAA